MLELARNFGGGPLPMSAIAEQQDISRKYLHAVLTTLRSAGLVRSIRGTGGGYVLSRDPTEIRLDQILVALQGSLAISECADDGSACSRSGTCVGREVWAKVGEAIEGLLSAINLKELLARQTEIEAGAQMYYI